MSALGRVGRFLVIVVFTVVETAALAIWLALVSDAPTFSQTAALGIGILAVGLVVEHILTDVAVNGVDLSFPVLSVIAISVSEAALWAVWLLVAERVRGLEGLAVAAAVLSILLVPQHTVEDSVLRGRAFFSRLVDLRTLGFSLIEGVGATIWLGFVFGLDPFVSLVSQAGLTGVDPAAVGLAILAVALLVEHVIGVRFSRRTATVPDTPSAEAATEA